ncbi:MAG: tyrosine-type recombinase/integrase [Deltaproteobacteria bacterium]|nr:tyrosine-type recombinase/integrase [Deltaproteobacteria bacterium]
MDPRPISRDESHVATRACHRPCGTDRGRRCNSDPHLSVRSRSSPPDAAVRQFHAGTRVPVIPVEVGPQDAGGITSRAAGLAPVGWHTLRHTFASRLVAAGVPIRAVQDLLGHASIQMTMRYAHLGPQELRGAIDVLEPNRMGNRWATPAASAPEPVALARANSAQQSQDHRVEAVV